MEQQQCKCKVMYLPYIDGLRALAVLSVIACHLNRMWLPGGFSGVDVFFVISGFVVSLSVSGMNNTKVVDFLLHFYSRRLARIAPALIVSLLVTFIVAALFIPRSFLSSTNDDTGLFSFFGISNFVLAKARGNYFSPSAEYNPFTHTWSLAVEEQFYLLFPLLFIIWLNITKKGSLYVFAAGSAASLCAAFWAMTQAPSDAYYMFWTRFWELGAGVIVFQVLSLCGHSFTSISCRSVLAELLSYGSLILLVLGLVLTEASSAPYPGCVLSVLGTAGLLCFLHGRPYGFVHAGLSHPLLRYVGKISYSLYLWHWPVLALFRWTVGLESVSSYCAALAAIVVLSVCSYHCVESPSRRHAGRLPKVAVVVLGVSCLVGGYFAAKLILSLRTEISLSTVMKNSKLWYIETIDEMRSGANENLTISTLDAGGSVLWHYTPGAGSGNRTFRHSLFVIGDSHAIHYRKMLAKFTTETGAHVYAYQNAGQPYMSFYPPLPAKLEATRQRESELLADILGRIKPGDVVFLPSLRIPRMTDQSIHTNTLGGLYTYMVSDGARLSFDAGAAQAIPVLRQLTARGATVVFEAPTPNFRTSAFRCSDWFNASNPFCRFGNSISRADFELIRKPILDTYSRIMESVPGVTVWDPVPTLCTNATCSTFIGDKPVIFDGDHLTAYANDLLYPSFAAFVTHLEPPAATDAPPPGETGP